MKRAGFLLVALVLAAPFASAHPTLVTSDPENGARVAAERAGLVLRFSEALDSSLARASLQRADGSDVPVSVAVDAARPTLLRVATGPLAADGYALHWRVVGLDGHASEGDITFATGDAPMPTAAAADAPPGPDAPESLARGALLAGLLACAALPSLARVAWRDERPTRRVRIALSCSAALALAGGIGTLAAFTKESGVSLAAAIASVPGTLLALQLALTGLLAAFVARAWRDADAPSRGIGPAATGALAVHAAAGHVAGASSAHGFHLLLLGAHMVAAAVWVGGVLALALRADAPRDEMTRATRRFAPWAIASVVTLALTGIAQAGLALAAPSQLVTTPFGLVLVAKSVLLAALLAFGFYHERAARPDASPRARPRTLGAEVALLFVVVALAGALGATPGPSP